MDRVLFLVLIFIAPVVLGDQPVQITFNPDVDASALSYRPRHLGGSQYSTRFNDVTWDNEKWTLETTTLRPNDFRYDFSFAPEHYSF